MSDKKLLGMTIRRKKTRTAFWSKLYKDFSRDKENQRKESQPKNRRRREVKSRISAPNWTDWLDKSKSWLPVKTSQTEGIHHEEIRSTLSKTTEAIKMREDTLPETELKSSAIIVNNMDIML